MYLFYKRGHFLVKSSFGQVRELIEVKEVITPYVPSNFPTCESSVKRDKKRGKGYVFRNEPFPHQLYLILV